MPITFHVIENKDITIQGDVLIGMTVLRWSTIDFPKKQLIFKHKDQDNNENIIDINFEDQASRNKTISLTESHKKIENNAETNDDIFDAFTDLIIVVKNFFGLSHQRK